MKRIIAILAATAIVPILFAAPFNPHDVAADPALLVHVDCDALRASSLGQSFLTQPDVQDKLATVEAFLDFDVRKQLHGLTVYTPKNHPKDGALIVYADFNTNRLIALAETAPEFESDTNGSHVIYSWLGKKKKADDDERPRVYGALLGHRIVFGQNAAHLAEALDVIDGKAPTYAGEKGLPAAAAGESVLAQGVILKFDFASEGPESAIFKMSKSVRLKLSEVANNTTAAVHFEAADAGTASQIDMVAQGLIALLKLQTGNSAVLKLAKAIVIKQDGPAVVLTLSMPSSELAESAKARANNTEPPARETQSPTENK